MFFTGKFVLDLLTFCHKQGIEGIDQIDGLIIERDALARDGHLVDYQGCISRFRAKRLFVYAS